MKITKEWLKKEGACREGIEWFEKFNETESEIIIKQLAAENKPLWAHWLAKRTAFTGLIETRYPNGQVKCHKTYREGKEEGTHEVYYESGQLKYQWK